MKLRYAACAFLILSSTAISSAMAADNGGPWTQDQLKKLCYFRAQKDKKNAKRYDICMQRHTASVGKPKKPGEVSELNKADALLAQKAASSATAATAAKAPK